MSARLHRRKFLQAGTAAGLGYLFAGPAVSVSRVFGANDKLRVAGVGVGGKGSSDIDQAGNLMDVVALCDIDDNMTAPKVKKWPSAKTFVDYRKMFDAMGKEFDAVTVSTPDHHHALAAATAIRMGKHVYCQKPLTHSVWEAHLLRKLAKEHKVCTQMGNQGTSENGLRRAAELIQAGEIGAVKEVHIWTNRPVWPQAPDVTADHPTKTAACPPNVHWEEFIGPAPEMAYHVDIHPFKWRGYWAFGTGAIGDMACHTANMAFMALKLTSPTHVTAESTGLNPLTCPSSAHVTMQFPARGDLPPVKLQWYEGKKDGQKLVPPAALVAQAVKLDTNPKHGGKLVNSGSILVGEKGIAYSPDDYGAEVYFSTGAKTNSGTKPEKLPTNGKGDQGQKNEWVAAIKAGKPEVALSNFEYASMLTASFLLGNVAIRTGKAFDFNCDTLAATGGPEAADLIKGTYRKGWELTDGKA